MELHLVTKLQSKVQETTPTTITLEGPLTDQIGFCEDCPKYSLSTRSSCAALPGVHTSRVTALPPARSLTSWNSGHSLSWSGSRISGMAGVLPPSWGSAHMAHLQKEIRAEVEGIIKVAGILP